MDRVGRGFVGEGVVVDEDEEADGGGFGDFEDGREATVAGFLGDIFPAVGKKAFVDQDICILDVLDVIGGGVGCGVGHVGDAAGGPVKAEGVGAARMGDGERGQAAVLGSGVAVASGRNSQGSDVGKSGLARRWFWIASRTSGAAWTIVRLSRVS